MPTYEYVCTECNNAFSEFYKTFKEAKWFEDAKECPACCEIALRVPSKPMPAHLYGDPEGYHNPSPTKRFNTKTVSQIEGNSNSMG